MITDNDSPFYGNHIQCMFSFGIVLELYKNVSLTSKKPYIYLKNSLIIHEENTKEMNV
jgi:hypothetical protein